ncbi:MAG TPA: hypothetical protein DDW45_07410 [Gammaproteobacteria bacterium]|nr:hypothetical protein [Gammaproteobacteria bacterium]
MMRLFLLLLFVVLTPPLYADDVTDPYDRFRGENDRDRFDFDDTLADPWKEQMGAIPAVSLQALKKLTIDHGPIDASLYLDQDSIQVNKKDRMVRYWIAIKSGDRISSLNYEGLRCSTGEYRSYAYASPRNSKQIMPLKNSRWRSVKQGGTRDYHHELAKNYLCSTGLPRTLKGIKASLGGAYELHAPYSQLLDRDE